MPEFLQTLKQQIRAPQLYLYWVIASVGILATHFNSGLRGTPVLGAISISATFFSLAIFYHHLNAERIRLGLPSPYRPWMLFFQIYLFRLCLFLLVLPLIAYFFKSGAFNNFTQNFTSVTMLEPGERGPVIWDLVVKASPWLFAIFMVLLVDQVGRTHIVAQGNSRKTFRRLAKTFWAIKYLILLFMTAELVVMLVDLRDVFDDPLEASKSLQGPLGRIALTPFKYLLEMAATCYFAKVLASKHPSLMAQ